MFRAVLERADGPVYHPPDEEPTHHGNNQHGNRGVGERARAADRYLSIRLREGKVGIQNAENLLVGRMRMARCIGTAGLIFDGRYDSQHPVSAAVAVNSKSIGTIEPGQRLGLVVATVTSLRRLVEDV